MDEQDYIFSYYIGTYLLRMLSMVSLWYSDSKGVTPVINWYKLIPIAQLSTFYV